MGIPLVRGRDFYRSFCILAGTLILEQAVVLSVNLADNVMIGSYSETALAGVAAVNQIQFFVQQVAYAISNGLIVLASQYWGQKRTGPIRQLTSVALSLELLFAALLFLVTSLFPERCVGLFLQDPEAVGEGVRYLRILRFTYPFFAVTTVLLGAMRSVETVRLALGVSVVSLAVNCGINFVLIAGRFGAPELGVRGAAIGTLTARILELLLTAYFVFFRDRKLQLKLGGLLRDGRGQWRDYGRTAAPIILQGALWGVATAIQTVILGRMSANAVSAYSISSTVFLLLKVTAVGACTAASILVGKQIGSGERESLRQTVVTLQLLFLGVGLLLGGLLFAVRLPLLSLYQISAETYRLANTFLLIQCVVICGMSYQMPTNLGIIRGGGDTRYGMVLDLVSIWGIVVPLSCLGAFVWDWPPAAVVICLNSDQLFKCVPAVIRANRYRWVRQLTREPGNRPDSP